MTATITAYGVGMFIHVLAVLVAFGPTLAFPIFNAVARKTDPRSVPSVLRGILAADRFLVIPGMVVLTLAGISMLAERHISVGESWVGVGIAAIAVLFGMAHGFFMPRSRQALEIAERGLAGGRSLSPDFDAIAGQIESDGKIATLIMVVTIFFMVVKP